jgi:hypothetical protein
VLETASKVDCLPSTENLKRQDNGTKITSFHHIQNVLFSARVQRTDCIHAVTKYSLLTTRLLPLQKERLYNSFQNVF